MNGENKTKLSAKEKRQASKERVLSMSGKDRKKYYLKKSLVVTVLLLAVIVAIFVVAKCLSDAVASDEKFIEQIEEVYPTYTPFPAEWKADLSKDESYLSLNTNIMYGVGETGSLYSLSDFFTSNAHEGQEFFLEYFRILREGDCEKYASLFAESYKKIPAEKRFEKNVDRMFPPQRVYDITVREIGRYNDEKKDIIYGVYFVDYKIDRNSNLFRNDIGRNPDLSINTSRPLYFQLVTTNPYTQKSETRISNMYTESSALAYAKNSSSAEE